MPPVELRRCLRLPAIAEELAELRHLRGYHELAVRLICVVEEVVVVVWLSLVERAGGGHFGHDWGREFALFCQFCDRLPCSGFLFRLARPAFADHKKEFEAKAEARWNKAPGNLCLLNGREVGLPKEHCETAQLADRLLPNLVKAAGFSEKSYRLTIQNGFYPDAFSSRKNVILNIGALEMLQNDGAGLAYLMAHELGHGIQKESGLATDNDRALNDFGFWQKQIEAQADVIGIQIFVRAGYSSKDYLGAESRLDTCIHIKDLYHGENLNHPGNQDRYFNVAIASYLLSLNSPDESGSGVIQPLFNPDDFSMEGLLKPSAALEKLGLRAEEITSTARAGSYSTWNARELLDVKRMTQWLEMKLANAQDCENSTEPDVKQLLDRFAAGTIKQFSSATP